MAVPWGCGLAGGGSPPKSLLLNVATAPGEPWWVESYDGANAGSRIGMFMPGSGGRPRDPAEIWPLGNHDVP